MEQKAFLAVTAMLNSFPQGNGNPDLTMSTYEAALRGVTSQAIAETAQRFTCGDVSGQSRTFAPAIAEFVQEARRIDELIPYRNRPALPKPEEQRWQPQPRENRVRMGFKMTVLSKAIEMGRVDDVATANKRGLEDLIALAQTWGLPVPDELFEQLPKRAA